MTSGGALLSSLTYVKLKLGSRKTEKYLNKYWLEFSKFDKNYKPTDQRSSMNLKGINTQKSRNK